MAASHLFLIKTDEPVDPAVERREALHQAAMDVCFALVELQSSSTDDRAAYRIRLSLALAEWRRLAQAAMEPSPPTDPSN